MKIFDLFENQCSKNNRLDTFFGCLLLWNSLFGLEMAIYWPDYVDSTCRQNHTYFDSGEFLLSAYHFIALFTLPLAIFTFFVIIRVTPKKMKKMKIPMIISHAWSTNLDFFLTVLAAPCLFFPSAAGVPLGTFSALGVSSRFVAYYGQVSIVSKYT